MTLGLTYCVMLEHPTQNCPVRCDGPCPRLLTLSGGDDSFALFGALLLAGYLVAENWLGPTIAVLLQSVAQSAARTLRR